MDLDAAAQYHERRRGSALLVTVDGDIVLERYAPPMSLQAPHALYSGTKSFWGTAAIEAQADGLLSLDERVWNGATFRDLLSLTAGVPFGGLGSAVPPYEKALATVPNAAPGERFTYGGIPLQIFGAIFSRRLSPRGLTPHQYLFERVLKPARTEIAKWRTLKDGTRPLPTGAFVTARDWAAYGRYVVANASRYAQCFRGSAVNPRYGLAWWLASDEVVYASGSGGQAMYLVPAQRLVIVRFGEGGSLDHQAFLRRCKLL